jgi:predicted dehydrogenase
MKTLRIIALIITIIVSSKQKAVSRDILPPAHCSLLTAHYSDTVSPWKFITLDPGHFHAALVQKSMYPEVDANVHVYAPKGTDVKLHLNRINSYNSRAVSPTSWNEIIFEGDDFFDRMLTEKKGNIVMLAGNNRKKTEYILKSISAGFNVYADKPMVISAEAFPMLEQAFRIAADKKLLLYDIMTERYEITTMIQKELSLMPEIFGKLVKGSPENPAITKESVHHFYKEVSGAPLQRPAWFYDVEQEGEGIVDVTTHLVDMVQWEAFPEKIIDHKKDIRIGSAKRWNTPISLAEFKASTSLAEFPDYLKKYTDNNGNLQVSCNGEINYTLKGIHAKVSVIWNYKAEPGGGDTHYSIMRGSLCDLVIRQGREQKFQPKLCIEKSKNLSTKNVELAFSKLEKKYPGIKLTANEKGWEVIIPDSYREGHEAHFARVTEKYLGYLKAGKLPAWEVPNMIAKYYTTTQARKQSQNSKVNTQN